MEAYPLTDPSGVVRAWACGRCRRVGGGMDVFAPVPSDEQIARLTEHSKSQADRCCRCRGCGGYVRRELGHESPHKCDACWEAGAAERQLHADNIAARDLAHAAVYAEALSRAKDRISAEHLRDYMSDLSEEHYCAGWLMGLEHTLWSFVVSGEPGRWGMAVVSAEKIARLRELSERAGGWWAWPDGGWGEVFVERNAWERDSVGRVSKGGV